MSRTNPQCTAGRHGTALAHRADKCVCPEARADHNRQAKIAKHARAAGRPLTVDATGTHRRLRALMTIGWRARDIAEQLGWWSGELDTLFRRRNVHRRTADAITAIYDKLANTPGPSESTRRRMIRAGHLPPLAWDDELIDDPTYDPRSPAEHAPAVSPALPFMPLEIVVRDAMGDSGAGAGNRRPAEVVHAARRIRAQDTLSIVELAAHVGISDRTIWRILNDADRRAS